MFHLGLAVNNENMMNERRKDAADINHLQGNIKELKMALAEKTHLLEETMEKERMVNSLQKSLSVKLKSEKDEVRRLNNILQQREAQNRHILRKKEIEIEKLKERLHRLISRERGSEAKVSTLVMTTPLVRSDKTRALWRTDNSSLKHEEELYRKVLSQYESWVNQLTDEGDQLKECLASVSSKIAKITLSCCNQENIRPSGEEHVLTKDGLENEPDTFSLNFCFLRSKIEKKLEENLDLIASALNSKEVVFKKTTDDHSGKEDVVESTLDNSLADRLEFLAESQCVEREHLLKEQMNHFREEKLKLQREREAFAFAAVRLNREKVSFEAEKVELLKQQFLEDLPQTPLRHSSKEDNSNQSIADLFGDSPRILKSMPLLSSPTGNVVCLSTPTTLGPQYYRESDSDTFTRLSGRPRGGRRSVPASRTASLNRDEGCEGVHKVRTLERPGYSSSSLRSYDSKPKINTASLISHLSSIRDLPSYQLTASKRISSGCERTRLSAKLSLDSSGIQAKLANGKDIKTYSYQQPFSVMARERLAHNRDSGFCNEVPDWPTAHSSNLRELQNALQLDSLESTRDSGVRSLEFFGAKNQLKRTSLGLTEKLSLPLDFAPPSSSSVRSLNPPSSSSLNPPSSSLRSVDPDEKP